MKKILLTLATVAALASCSKDETLNSSREAIGFTNVFVENSTKANGNVAEDPSFNTTNKLTAFNVWGSVTAADGTYVPVFRNDKVVGTEYGSDKVWNCTTTTQYWIPTAKYNFAAVVNADTEVVNDKTLDKVTLTNCLPSSIDFTYVDATAKDLLYAKSNEYTGLNSGNPLVAFTFNHLLSKTIFTINGTTLAGYEQGSTLPNSQHTKYTYEVKDIKINNVTSTNKCDVTGEKPSWNERVATAITTANYGTVTGNFDGVDEQCENAKLLIPGTYEANISFTVDIKYDGKVITTYNYNPIVNVTFAPGNSYNFTIGVNIAGPIQFAVTTINNWNPISGTPSQIVVKELQPVTSTPATPSV